MVVRCDTGCSVRNLIDLKKKSVRVKTLHLPEGCRLNWWDLEYLPDGLEELYLPRDFELTEKAKFFLGRLVCEGEEKVRVICRGYGAENLVCGIKEKFSDLKDCWEEPLGFGPDGKNSKSFRSFLYSMASWDELSGYLCAFGYAQDSCFCSDGYGLGAEGAVYIVLG